MKNILITGVNGLLGQALIQLLKKDYNIIGSSIEEDSAMPGNKFLYKQLDITNNTACKSLCQDFNPNIIINAASFTHVDQCEIEKELCWQVNVKAIENLAQISRRYNTHLIHYSTDYIFSGIDGPYSEKDRPKPLGYYGKSKLASENVLRQIGCPSSTIRTCVLFGTGYTVKKNFFLWVLENLQAGKEINVVTDQFNNPTLAEDLAIGTKLILENKALGVFHMAGHDYLNRFDFALAIADIFNLSKELIKPIKTDHLTQLANRPMQGGLKIELAKNQLGYNPRNLNESLIYLRWKIGKNGE
jgi:dTDP-4-dehydrorhamnose reductase